MNVMNIKHYLSAVAALGLLAACSEYDPGMSDQAIDLTDAEIETIEEYRANFIARYGEPAEGHTWGFGAKGSEDEMGTRAVQVNRNMWAVAVKENNTVVGVTTAVGTDTQDGSGNHFYEYTTKEGYVIPGFPSTVDGLYYIEENNQQVGYTKEQIMSKMQYNQVQPAGDVTDEEIEYVSWWFRTHPNITSETPPFTEYFVQDISQDFDRESYPDGDWKDYDGNGRKVTVKLYNKSDDSFVRDDGTESINYGMDYFSVKTKESDGSDFWEHNNNLNKQKANPIDRNAPATATDITALKNSTTTYPNRTLKYWTSEGPSQQNTNGKPVYKDGKGYTTSFSFHNSDDSHDYENYVLVHLKFKGPRTGLDYDGWYLGFDYEMHKYTDVGEQYKKTDVEPDGYYSNWIVKLAPGNPEFYEDHKWHRIMCEDLGATDDYDFNDLVYDVYFTGTNDQYTAHIKVLASGGTLPIYVGTYKENDAREAHQLLQDGNAQKLNGGKLYQPVNVSAGVTADPVEFEFEMKDASGKWLTGAAGTDPDYIPILVTSTDEHRQTASGKNTFVLPTVKDNPVPQKICIDGNKIDATKVRWMKERKQIETTYTLFDKWAVVGDKDNSDYHFGKPSDWTSHGLENLGNRQ